jgi:hypothetical protein
MVVDPELMPDTTPVPVTTLAIPVDELDQVPPVVASAMVMVWPAHTKVGPVITFSGFTLTVKVALHVELKV